MSDTYMDLRKQPEITELFEALEESGLEKEKSQVSTLVDYIEGMESQLSEVLAELKEVREEIFQDLAEKFSFEFTIRNCHMDREEYLSRIMLDEGRLNDEYRHLKSLYNDVLRDNCDIGHNNFSREIYLTISTRQDTPDDAMRVFELEESRIEGDFSALYGFRAEALGLSERLELLHGIYHPEPGAVKFGSKVDYDGKGFSIDSMQRMGMNTKDVIEPENYDYRERDYMRLGNFYARTFFVGSIPESVPDSLLLDFSSVSSNSIVSVYYRNLFENPIIRKIRENAPHFCSLNDKNLPTNSYHSYYENMDTELGFRLAAGYVRDNTKVKDIPIRDTVADRKSRRTYRQQDKIYEDEEQYFYDVALDMFKRAKAKDQTMIQAAFIITLFAESLDELERNYVFILAKNPREYRSFAENFYESISDIENRFL